MFLLNGLQLFARRWRHWYAFRRQHAQGFMGFVVSTPFPERYKFRKTKICCLIYSQPQWFRDVVCVSWYINKMQSFGLVNRTFIVYKCDKMNKVSIISVSSKQSAPIDWNKNKNIGVKDQSENVIFPANMCQCHYDSDISVLLQSQKECRTNKLQL